MSTNMNLLRGKLKERSMTQQELAHKIGMDSSTLSRKLASDGLKFTVGEMHDIAATLNLTANECKSIFFFAVKLAFLQVYPKEVKKMTQNELTQVLLCASLVLGIVTAFQRWKNHW